MKKYAWGIPTLLSFPFITSAAWSIQTLFANIIIFLDAIVIPFLLGIAFLIFVINVIRFFVIEGASEDGRDKAKALAIYSVAAFVFIIIFWGAVNLLVSSTGLGSKDQPCPDYITKFGGTCAK